jgi:hypothetical protein
MRNVESKRNRMEWNLDFYGKKMNASSQKKNPPVSLFYTQREDLSYKCGVYLKHFPPSILVKIKLFLHQ